MKTLRLLLLVCALLLPGGVMAQMNNAPLVSTSVAGVVSGTYGHFLYVSTTNLAVNGIVFTNGGGAGDRISTTNVSSGANLGMVVADRGTVSFTLAGTAGAAYIHPTLGFVGPGVSATGVVSATGFYSSGNVGIGAAATTTVPLYVLSGLDNTMTLSRSGTGSWNYIRFTSNTTPLWATGYDSSGMYMVGNYIAGAWQGARLGITSAGNVGLGVTSPASKLEVAGDVSASGNMTAVAYLHSSDRRLKDNIVPVADAMGLVKSLNGVHFTWKKDGRPSYGVIAQDVQKVMPEAVHGGGSTTMVVDSDQLIAPLIEAVKIQQKQIDDLRREVDELRAKQAGR
ncbi:MAG TPA: tail fiber domain-containing protein [Alphaproteobacteria bacterium]|nr:tail fiber domain-containing protein [Alphaproteobacteria bacterium]